MEKTLWHIEKTFLEKAELESEAARKTKLLLSE